jgi:hypothetical protein
MKRFTITAICICAALAAGCGVKDKRAKDPNDCPQPGAGAVPGRN